jgi:hypothetical protein
LAEHGTPVTAVVASQRRTGRIAGVGRDFFVLEPRQGYTALVLLDAVGSLWPDQDGIRFPTGARGGAIELTFAMAMALLGEQRSPICVVTATGLEIAGDLVAAGDDVLTLRSDVPARRLVYVPLRAAALCELR